MQIGGWKREAMPTQYIGRYDEDELKDNGNGAVQFSSSRSGASRDAASPILLVQAI
jgi:hypothetical protein